MKKYVYIIPLTLILTACDTFEAWISGGESAIEQTIVVKKEKPKAVTEKTSLEPALDETRGSKFAGKQESMPDELQDVGHSEDYYAKLEEIEKMREEAERTLQALTEEREANSRQLVDSNRDLELLEEKVRRLEMLDESLDGFDDY